MKTSEIQDCRKFHNRFSLCTTSATSLYDSFIRNEIDFDVFLPSIGLNLQRKLVWSLDQKRELIYSILKSIPIGNASILRNIFPFTKEEIDQLYKDKAECPDFFKYQVIDGKQRLMTIIDFLGDIFKILIDEEYLYFSELPLEFKRIIWGYNISSYEISMGWGVVMSDAEKIEWFQSVSFKGTPQEESHLAKLTIAMKANETTTQ